MYKRVRFHQEKNKLMKTVIIVLFINMGFLSCQEPSKEITNNDIVHSHLLYESKKDDTTIVTQNLNDAEIVDNTPKWDWVAKVVKTGSITPTAYANTIVDSSGNAYITNYAPTLDHNIDVYLAKFNNKGGKEWELLMGGKGWDSGHDLAFDNKGNIWIVGYFTEKAKFGNITLTGDNKFNLFLAKIDANGVCRNAIKVASDNRGFSYSNGTIGDGQLGGFSIFINPENEIFLSGEFEKELSFNHIRLTSNRRRSSFIGKFDLFGKCIWAVKAESSNWCYSSVIHHNTKGDTYFHSSCSDTLFAGDKSMVANSPQTNDILLAKISADGKCEWIKRINNKDESTNSNKLGSSNESAENDLFYLHATPANIKIFNSQFSDKNKGIWLGEISMQGDWLRTLPLGNKANDGEGVIWDYTLDSDNNIYMIGTFNGMMYFGNEAVINRENTRGAGFVAKYRFDGTCEWVKVIQCDGKILWLRSVKVIDDMLFLSGNYQLIADFDNLRIETNEQNTNVNEIFLAKLNLK